MNVRNIADKVIYHLKWLYARIPLDMGFMNIIASIGMLYFLLSFQRQYGIRPFTLSFASAFYVLYSLVTINALVQLINMATYRIRFVRIAANAVFLVLFILVHAYHLVTHIPLNCALVIDNFSIGFHLESLSVITGVFPRPLLIGLGIFVAVLLVAHWRKGILASPISPGTGRSRTVAAVAIYLLVLCLPLRTYDGITELFREMVRYPFNDRVTGIEIRGYPYMRTFSERSNVSRGPTRPSVILVMVESYNAGFVMKKTGDGREITPVFNSLIGRGVYVERFYGNSVQTSKGQTAALLSVIPSIRGKLFTNFPGLRFRALPAVMGDAGYRTLFVQAAQKLSFEHTGRFMRRAGFQEVHSAYEFLKETDSPRVWGWGPEDEVFFRICLERIDAVHEKNAGRPIFATLATISNHMWFDHLPKDRRALYPEPAGIEERYANSIHLSDRGLATLIEGIRKRPYLANTLIIITGDHSFPVNEHGISHNETGFYEEMFRTPFLMLWEGLLSPRRIDGPYSQVDIAPTVLDAAGIGGVRCHFTGRSILAPGGGPSPVYLVQPYNGQYLCIVDYPLKYVYHDKSKKEYLFDLKKDPREANDLVDTRYGRRVRSFMRRQRGVFYVNQKVLVSDRLWDGE